MRHESYLGRIGIGVGTSGEGEGWRAACHAIARALKVSRSAKREHALHERLGEGGSEGEGERARVRG